MKHFITYCLLLCIPVIPIAQTTEDYFSKPGLVLSGFVESFTGYGFDTSSSSYTYTGRKVLCGDTVLVFSYNQYYGDQYVFVDGKKVYKVDTDCNRELMYDFGLVPGEKMTEGIYTDYTVTSKSTIMLENGDMRPMVEVIDPGQSWSENWVEGIGSIQGGFIPFRHFEGWQQFVCARDSSGMLWTNTDYVFLCDSFSCLQPRPKFTHERNEYEITLTNQSEFATHYLWDFGNGVTSTAESPAYVYPEADCIVLSLKAYNSCYTTDVERTAIVPVCVTPDWDTLQQIPDWTSFQLTRISDQLQFITRGDKIRRSIDNGNTWHNVTAPAIGTYENFGRIYMYNSEQGIAVARRHGTTNTGGIIITKDGGLTWEFRAPNTPNLHRLTIGTNGRAWACSDYDTYFMSQDFGETWVDLTDSVDVDLDEIWAFGDTLIAGVVEGHISEAKFSMAKSFDGGLHWQQFALPEGYNYMEFITPLLGYATSEYGVAKTTDGGELWNIMLPGSELYGLTFLNDSVGWIQSNSRIVYYTNDGLTTYRKSNCNGLYLQNINPISETEAIATSNSFIISYDGDRELNCTSTDLDGDGYSDAEDCKDENVLINPGATEIPGNGIDENCDGDDFISAIHDLNGYRVEIYPNPTRDWVFIETSSTEPFTIHLMDAAGSVIHRQSGLEAVNLSELAVGVYLLNVMTSAGEEVVVERIIKL